MHATALPASHPIVAPHPADEVMFASRLRQYDAMFRALGVVPFGERRLYDAGCANGKFLDICCRRWGAREDRCIGSDTRRDAWDRWSAAHPASRITFVHGNVKDAAIEPGVFDLVHQSMVLSWSKDREQQAGTAEGLWRALRPGGLLVSYDFRLNPTNPRTTGVRLSTLRMLFPDARVLYSRSVTLAPPLCRRLLFAGARALVTLESLRLLNSHLLVALEKPAS